MVSKPSVLPEPEEVPIPDADDLVPDILTDQMIDFDESSTDAPGIFAVTGGDKERVEVNERKMTDGGQETLSQCKGGRVAVVDGSQSL